jgi:hypothetical protein
MMNPLAISVAVRETREFARSALPDAPAVPDPPRRRPRTTRHAMARGLRWAANRLEPSLG